MTQFLQKLYQAFQQSQQQLPPSAPAPSVRAHARPPAKVGGAPESSAPKSSVPAGPSSQRAAGLARPAALAAEPLLDAQAHLLPEQQMAAAGFSQEERQQVINALRQPADKKAKERKVKDPWTQSEKGREHLLLSAEMIRMYALSHPPLTASEACRLALSKGHWDSIVGELVPKPTDPMDLLFLTQAINSAMAGGASQGTSSSTAAVPSSQLASLAAPEPKDNATLVLQPTTSTWIIHNNSWKNFQPVPWEPSSGVGIAVLISRLKQQLHQHTDEYQWEALETKVHTAVKERMVAIKRSTSDMPTRWHLLQSEYSGGLPSFETRIKAKRVELRNLPVARAKFLIEVDLRRGCQQPLPV